MSHLLDNTLGAELMGVLCATLLYGMTVVQAGNYFASANDSSLTQSGRLRMKAAAAYVLIGETIHTAFIWYWLYWIVVKSYGNIFALNAIPWPLVASLMVFNLTAVVVQIFFTYRIYIITGRWWYSLPLWILEGVEVGTVAALVHFAAQSTGFLNFHEHYNYLVYLVLCVSATIDVCNTILLCVFLKKMDGGHAATRQIVNSVIMFALETGCFQTLAAILTLILWIAKPSAGLWVASLMIHAKLYSNSLLGTLNARSRLRTKLQASRSGSSGGRVEGVTIALSSRNGNSQVHEIPELSSTPSTAKSPNGLMTFAVRKDVVVESV